MSHDLRDHIERSLSGIGQVDYTKRAHRKGLGPARPRCLPPEDLAHEQAETLRRGSGNRIHYRCSIPKCAELIRNDKWAAHVLKSTSDQHMQEPAADVLERACNFVPDGAWSTRESRLQRIVRFMEQRHYLALARQHDEKDLAEKITEANRFYVRLTNMVRS